VGIAGANHGLELKEIAQGEGTLEGKDRRAGSFARLLLNGKGSSKAMEVSVRNGKEFVVTIL